jgi:hypothetical protein
MSIQLNGVTYTLDELRERAVENGDPLFIQNIDKQITAAAKADNSATGGSDGLSAYGSCVERWSLATEQASCMRQGTFEDIPLDTVFHLNIGCILNPFHYFSFALRREQTTELVFWEHGTIGPAQDSIKRIIKKAFSTDGSRDKITENQMAWSQSISELMCTIINRLYTHCDAGSFDKREGESDAVHEARIKLFCDDTFLHDLHLAKAEIMELLHDHFIHRFRTNPPPAWRDVRLPRSALPPAGKKAFDLSYDGLQRTSMASARDVASSVNRVPPKTARTPIKSPAKGGKKSGPNFAAYRKLCKEKPDELAALLEK